MTSRNLTATFRFCFVSSRFSSLFPLFPPKKTQCVSSPLPVITVSFLLYLVVFFCVKPPSSRLYSLLPPLVRPVSTFSTLLPRTWVGRSTRRFTRRLSSSAPRRTIRCVFSVIFQHHHTSPIPIHTHTIVTLLTDLPPSTIQCLSVQCIYCQQIRAKNTSRQKQHLLECPGLRGHPSAPQPQAQSAQATANGINAANGYPPTPNGPTAAATGAGPGPGTALPTPNGPIMSNGVNPHATPMQTPLPNMSGRGTLSTPGAPPTAGAGSSTGTTSQQGSRATPKPKQKAPAATSLPSPPLDDVHAAFVEFRAKEEDKVRGFGHFSPYGNNAMSGNHDLTGKPQCLSVQCIYCQQVRAKNTSRQRQHLLECPTYLSVMKDSIPANNLLHTFPEGEVARSLQLPTPTLELDFRMSIKMNPRVSVGQTLWGQRDWVSFIGGQWAGRWGKGIILVRFPSSSIVQSLTKPSLEGKILKSSLKIP